MFSRRSLSCTEWARQAENHRARLAPFLEEHRFRHTRGLRHPVYDFLFSYYSFSGGQLLRWSPGIDVRLETQDEAELDWSEHFSREGGFCYIDPRTFPERRIPFLRWAARFLDTTFRRQPVFHCFGLHEWAMLYRTPDSRYPGIPLRVSAKEIERLIDEGPVRCTHYDAFRFFSAAAKPRNRAALGPKIVTEHDQPGCIHANMDLYRLAYKIAPCVPSNFLGDLFLLARDARELDMRASPYDLRGFQFSPIPIETRAGREMYVEEQRLLYERAQPHRAGLLGIYRRLLESVPHSVVESSRLPTPAPLQS